jgi:signal transduction histidine kinase
MPRLLNGQRYGVHWALPLGGTAPAGALLFDGRGQRWLYSEEEIDLAQACCERIMDALAGARLTNVAVGLLRQRIAEVKVLGARQRRVLHDEVLPGLHAALIHLGGAHSDTDGLLLAPVSAAAISASLSDAHRRLADLIRAMPAASPHRLEQEGLAAALETMLRRDFAQGFEQASWQVEPNAAEAAARLAPFAAEALFYAAQEAVRNAARHGRGAESERPLRLELRLAWADGLQISVIDDGVGLAERSPSTGSGSGLQFHQAMLAVIGGSMQVEPRTGGGTLVRLFLPADRAE